MNKYTWSVTPRGKTPIKVSTFGKTHDAAKEVAREIVRDVWKETFAESPSLQIDAVLLTVEEVLIPINDNQEFL